MNETLSPAAISGEKRSFTADIQDKGYLKNIKIVLEFESPQVENRPTIFAANHFARRRIDRGIVNPLNIIFNTRESMLTIGAISIGGEQLTGGRPISWVIEQDLEVKVGEAAKQKKFIEDYDHIPMSKYKHEAKGIGGGSKTYSEIANKLTSGKSVAVFIEGEPGQKIRGNSNSLAALLLVLGKRKKIDVQVIPVSIFYQDKAFRVIFSKPILASQNPRKDAAEAVTAITSKLPQSLRP